MGLSLGQALGLAGTAVDAFTAITAGDDNAAASRDQARRVAQRTELEVARTRRLARRTRGAQIAGFGRAGVAVAGTVLDVIADSAAQADLDVELLRLGGSVEQNLALSQAREATRRGTGVALGGALAGIGRIVERP